jgi:hypothetical protein
MIYSWISAANYYWGTLSGTLHISPRSKYLHWYRKSLVGAIVKRWLVPAWQPWWTYQGSPARLRYESGDVRVPRFIYFIINSSYSQQLQLPDRRHSCKLHPSLTWWSHLTLAWQLAMTIAQLGKASQSDDWIVTDSLCYFLSSCHW